MGHKKCQILKLDVNGVDKFAHSNCLSFFYSTQNHVNHDVRRALLNEIRKFTILKLEFKKKTDQREHSKRPADGSKKLFQKLTFLNVQRRRNGPIRADHAITRKWTSHLLSSTHFCTLSPSPSRPRALRSNCRRERVRGVQVCRPAGISCCGKWRRRSSGSGLWLWPGCSDGSPTGWCPPPESGCWATAASSPRPNSGRGQVRKTAVVAVKMQRTHINTLVCYSPQCWCCCYCYCQQGLAVK